MKQYCAADELRDCIYYGDCSAKQKVTTPQSQRVDPKRYKTEQMIRFEEKVKRITVLIIGENLLLADNCFWKVDQI